MKLSCARWVHGLGDCRLSPNVATILYSLWAKNFKTDGEKIKIFHGIEHFMEIVMLVPINKVFLAHSHAHSFAYCLWLLLPYNCRLSGLPCGQRLYMACKALNIYYLVSLCGKSWLNFELFRKLDLKKKAVELGD